MPIAKFNLSVITRNLTGTINSGPIGMNEAQAQWSYTGEKRNGEKDPRISSAVLWVLNDGQDEIPAEMPKL